MKQMYRILAVIVLALLVAVPGNAASDYAKTRYPIVLVHGFAGAKSILGIVEYWYGIPQKLNQYGNAQVYVATVSSFAGEDIRAAQLETFVADVLNKTGAQKVNLIAHSQGGLTIRAYSALHPEKVASLTTVATPNHGNAFADLISKLNNNLGPALPGVRDAIVGVFNLFGSLNGALNGQDLPQDVLTALYVQTSAGAQEFARNVSSAGFNPDCAGPRPTRASGTLQSADGKTVAWGFPVYSWTGSGAPISLLRSGLDLLDPSSYIMAASVFAQKSLLNAGDSDGMTPVCSARLGEVIGENYYWSHLDEINQMMGLVPSVSGDPRMAFVIHANRLKLQGL
jgi:triacylglycerol lipase